MDEREEFLKKANTKLLASKILFESEDYSDSVSLSYYAMFLMAKILLIKKGVYPKTHSGMINTFYNEYVGNGDFDEEIFKNFARTQSLREKSDYSAFDGITEEIANDKIIQAEEFIAEAQKFL